MRLLLQLRELDLELEVLAFEEGGAQRDVVLFGAPGVPRPLGRLVVLPPALLVGLVVHGEASRAVALRGVVRPAAARRVVIQRVVEGVVEGVLVVARAAVRGVRVDRRHGAAGHALHLGRQVGAVLERLAGRRARERVGGGGGGGRRRGAQRGLEHGQRRLVRRGGHVRRRVAIGVAGRGRLRRDRQRGGRQRRDLI
jgi:hypothetical protein